MRCDLSHADTRFGTADVHQRVDLEVQSRSGDALARQPQDTGAFGRLPGRLRPRASREERTRLPTPPRKLVRPAFRVAAARNRRAGCCGRSQAGTIAGTVL